jgi:hypothetical protein
MILWTKPLGVFCPELTRWACCSMDKLVVIIEHTGIKKSNTFIMVFTNLKHG